MRWRAGFFLTALFLLLMVLYAAIFSMSVSAGLKTDWRLIEWWLRVPLAYVFLPVWVYADILVTLPALFVFWRGAKAKAVGIALGIYAAAYGAATLCYAVCLGLLAWGSPVTLSADPAGISRTTVSVGYAECLMTIAAIQGVVGVPLLYAVVLHLLQRCAGRH